MLQMTDQIEAMQKAWSEGLNTASQNFQSADGTMQSEKNTATEGGEKYSVRYGMSEEERYEELKDRKIAVSESMINEKHSDSISKLEDIKENAISKATDIIVPIARDIGILNRSMTSPEIDVEFEFSKNSGLNESIHQQKNYGGNYSDFAKALLNIDGILENAVLIEQHSDKYKGTIRENRNLENVSVLFGLFRDGESVIPTQFEIKKYKDKGTKSKLYMTVAMTKIEAGVLGSTVGKSQAHYLIPTSTYILSDVFSKINTQDKRFLKYM